ncbi:MAG: helix-turn-helix transcriptional regulator [Granulosicoccus sp.]
MNIIRMLRQKVGLNQTEFASQSGTSQSTIAEYESGAKSPTMRTVKRIAAKFNLEVEVNSQPRMTREDRRSLAYHSAIATHLKENPVAVVAQAQANLNRWIKVRPAARVLMSRWSLWLQLPVQDLTKLMLNQSTDCRDMRQVSPFAGVLSAAERAAILRQFQQVYAA